MHRELVATLDQSNFLGAGQLLVSTNAVDGIAERPGANGGNRDRIVALHAIFRSEFEPDCRITTDFSNSAVESKEFLGGEKDLVLAEQAHAQACTAQDRRGREPSIIEPSTERIANSKSVHDAVLKLTREVLTRLFILSCVFVVDMLHPVNHPFRLCFPESRCESWQSLARRHASVSRRARTRRHHRAGSHRPGLPHAGPSRTQP